MYLALRVGDSLADTVGATAKKTSSCLMAGRCQQVDFLQLASRSTLADHPVLSHP
jgi:hypothetical protein